MRRILIHHVTGTSATGGKNILFDVRGFDEVGGLDGTSFFGFLFAIDVSCMFEIV